MGKVCFKMKLKSEQKLTSTLITSKSPGMHTDSHYFILTLEEGASGILFQPDYCRQRRHNVNLMKYQSASFTQ